MSGIETQVENILGNYVAAIRIVYTVTSLTRNYPVCYVSLGRNDVDFRVKVYTTTWSIFAISEVKRLMMS